MAALQLSKQTPIVPSNKNEDKEESLSDLREHLALYEWQIRRADDVVDTALKLKNTAQMKKEETMKKVRGLQGLNQSVHAPQKQNFDSDGLSPNLQDNRQPTGSDTSLGICDPERYVFDFGRHKGKLFTDVPESYLRTLSGQAMLLDGRHKGLREAFDYHKPKLSQKSSRGLPGEKQLHTSRILMVSRWIEFKQPLPKSNSPTLRQILLLPTPHWLLAGWKSSPWKISCRKSSEVLSLTSQRAAPTAPPHCRQRLYRPQQHAFRRPLHVRGSLSQTLVHPYLPPRQQLQSLMTNEKDLSPSTKKLINFARHFIIQKRRSKSSPRARSP